MKASIVIFQASGDLASFLLGIHSFFKNRLTQLGLDFSGESSLAEGKVINEKCKLCLRHFNRQWQLDRHYKLHDQRFQMDEKVTCPKCQGKFSKLEFNTHFQAAHDPENGSCTEWFQTIPEDKLSRHLEIAHFYNLGNKLCPICGDKFNYPHQLKTHMEMVHKKEDTSVVCDYCSKLYPHKFKLKKHINMIHFDNKGPQTCKTCGRLHYNAAWRKGAIMLKDCA